MNLVHQTEARNFSKVFKPQFQFQTACQNSSYGPIPHGCKCWMESRLRPDSAAILYAAIEEGCIETPVRHILHFNCLH